GQRLIVNEIDLMLPPAPFALAALDRNASRSHLVANGAHERLIARRLHEMIINSIIARGLEVAVAAGKSGMVRLIEQVKLEFACAETGKTFLLHQIQLPAQNGPR